jgi:hypothetical protein
VTGHGRRRHPIAASVDLERAYLAALDRTSEAQVHWEAVRTPGQLRKDGSTADLSREQIEAETELTASWVDFVKARDAYFGSLKR